MKYEPIKLPPRGPCLGCEEVSEFWVWCWFAVRESRGAALDEAERLQEAFIRTLRRLSDTLNEWPILCQRDQGPIESCKLAHYLFTRTAQWTAMLDAPGRKAEAAQRLTVLEAGSTLFHRLVKASPAAMAASCERNRVGEAWEDSTVFRDSRSEGVVLETPDEGPVPWAEARRREKARWDAFNARWNAERNRPRRRRQLGGGAP